MRKFVLLFTVLITTVGFAQKSISGVITDAETAQPIPGASIIIEGTTIGVSSDFDGNYQLETPADTFTLIVSYIGFKTVKISGVEGTNTYNVTLEEDAAQLDEVIVSANKTEQRAQDVPLSITAVGAKELAKQGAIKAESYFSSIPNLSISSAGGGGASFGDGRASGRNIAIRGISGQNTTAFYLDETPLPEFADPRLFDINRIEVLRGPQGTLYGSNTLGGAVKVVTNQATAYETTGSIQVSGASVNEGDADYNIEGIINLPLIKEKLALRVGAFYAFETGVYDRMQQTTFNGFPLNTGDGTGPNPGAVADDADGNVAAPFNGSLPIVLRQNGNNDLAGNFGDNIDDETSFGINASLGIYPNENISIVPKVIYQNTEGSGLDFADFSPDNFEQYRIAGIDEAYELELFHASLLTKFQLGKGELINNISFTNVGQFDREDVSERESSGPTNTEITPFDEDGRIIAPVDAPPFSNTELTDAAFYPEFIDRSGDLNRIVEELRYSSKTDNKFNFTLGLFYSSESSEFTSVQPRQTYLEDLAGFFDNLVDIGVTEVEGLSGFIASENFIWYSQQTDFDTNEFALFGEGYWDITDKLKFTFGLRYFNFSQDFFQSIGGFVGNGGENSDVSVSDDGFTPKFNLTYKFNDKSLLYGSATRGFRLGGGNGAVPIIFAGDDLAALGLTQAPQTFDPDFLWTYEIGSKNTLLNNRLIANFSVFHTVWDNLQQRVFLPSGFLFVDNIGQAQLTGFEVELKGKLSEHLQVAGALGYTNAEVTEGSDFTGAEEGDRVLNTPEFTASGSIEYNHKVGKNNNSMFYRLDIQHTGERLNTFAPELEPQFVFDAFTIFNARVGYVSEKFDVAIFAQNLTNEIANFGDITSLAAVPFGRTRFATGRPSSIGASLKYKF